MNQVFLDHDYETGRVYIERDSDSQSQGYLSVEATTEEVAQWERAIAEFDRVQELMYQRWKVAIDAKIAKLPPSQPREPRPGEAVVTITRKDLIDDDGFPFLEITERIARAAVEKQLRHGGGPPSVVIQPEVK